jgi:hypothetical protein
MYRGSGVPTIVRPQGNGYSGKTITFPMPLKGKRKEEYEIANKVYTNIRGKRIAMPTKYRFKAEYEFGEVTSSLIDDLVEIHIGHVGVKLIPHIDFPYINYLIDIVKLTPKPLKGLISKNSLSIECVTVDYVYKIPTIDNMLGGMLLSRVGVIGNANLGV